MEQSSHPMTIKPYFIPTFNILKISLWAKRLTLPKWLPVEDCAHRANPSSTSTVRFIRATRPMEYWLRSAYRYWLFYVGLSIKQDKKAWKDTTQTQHDSRNLYWKTRWTCSRQPSSRIRLGPYDSKTNHREIALLNMDNCGWTITYPLENQEKWGWSSLEVW